MKPLIGITSSMGLGIWSMTQEFMPQEQHRLGDKYVQAIIRAGGIPVILPACEDPSVMEAMAEGLDGILLSGGGDVDPVCYGQRANGHLGTVSVRRDAAELALAKYVIEKTDKPLLGICRGVQVMNVAMGGSLYIDLPDAGKLSHSLTMYPRYVATHDVQVVTETRMAKIMDGASRVNSFHHEAVDVLAEAFQVSAISPEDGVIEAIELPGDRFVVGVQWHPEELTQHAEAQRLFRAFVEAAAK
ncbi:MAG: gamma-glutamyl-gamma-aminobutyrate hydrolase family protein [Oscillospiraceae bacterium]|nr:gamma-glutamyl-gamma-aminobutyrate hydrolase family protein [Oscillospiraceae bacterium]